MTWSDHFSDVIVLDFEFCADEGDRQRPVCLAAKSLLTGIMTKVWIEAGMPSPFAVDEDILFVGYFASAEWGCFLSLGWDLPSRVLDLYAEYRVLTNGLASPFRPKGNGLLSVAEAYGITVPPGAYKTEMRDLIIGGGPWAESERTEILTYCASDVDLTAELFLRMWPQIATGKLALTQAMFRGRYTIAAARMEFTGTPIDTELLGSLKEYWPELKHKLIKQVDRCYGVFDGLIFKQSKFQDWVISRELPWPRLDSGKLKLDDQTFKQMATSYPEVKPLHDLRATLSQMQNLKLAVGADGRNRTLLSPFASKTGRNQPSTTKFIFGNSAWLRSLIKPEEGYGLAYIDYSSQEIAIAAALSGDTKLWQAYASGDPYLAFAIQAGLAPEGATKTTHKDIRNRCKQIVLGVGYGMGAKAMALGAGLHISEANELLASHRMTYRRFWGWAEANQMRGMMGEPLITPLGWRIQMRRAPEVNDRSLLNWPMQSTGADIMRLAACLLTEGGIEVCCPVHDAFLVRFPLSLEVKIVEKAKRLMMEAAAVVLGDGFECRVDADIVRFPNRYADERGVEMYGRVTALLSEIKEGESA